MNFELLGEDKNVFQVIAVCSKVVEEGLMENINVMVLQTVSDILASTRETVAEEAKRHSEGIPLQVKNDSVAQVLEHPSLLSVLLSSQVSAPAMIPSPQRVEHFLVVALL